MRAKDPQQTLRAVFRLGLASAALAACSSSTAPETGPLPSDVKAILFLQRLPRMDSGNVFDYQSFVPGGRLVKLEPPSADGHLTVLISAPMFDGADIQSYDLSFDAASMVFSARLADAGNYHLFSMNLDGSNFRQLTEGANDYVYPIFIPGGRILYTTNLNVENFLDANSPSRSSRTSTSAPPPPRSAPWRWTAAAGAGRQECVAPSFARRCSRTATLLTRNGGTWAAPTTATSG